MDPKARQARSHAVPTGVRAAESAGNPCAVAALSLSLASSRRGSARLGADSAAGGAAEPCAASPLGAAGARARESDIATSRKRSCASRRSAARSRSCSAASIWLALGPLLPGSAANSRGAIGAGVPVAERTSLWPLQLAVERQTTTRSNDPAANTSRLRRFGRACARSRLKPSKCLMTRKVTA
jgi:hypothetical protein